MQIAQMPPVPMLIYVLVVIVSRFAFRHREWKPAGEGAPRPGRWRGVLLCMLPLALMQWGPFIEFMLRGAGYLQPYLEDARAFPRTMSAGILIYAGGTALAAFAARELRMAWSQDADQLCTAGIYGVVRHPMYAAYLVQGAGCGVMLGALWSWALYGLAVPLIFMGIVVEDRELAGTFPDAFPAYRERVKRLVPFVF